jgi:hypothetical protein
MLRDELVQVIQNLTLAFGERKHGSLLFARSVEVAELYANRRRKSRRMLHSKNAALARGS